MVEGGRAVRARGACTKSPSVRACVGLARSSPAQSGQEEERRDRGRHGAGLSSVCPASPRDHSRCCWQGQTRGLEEPLAPPRAWRVPAARAGAQRYSMTRQRGRCCEKYLKSSGVAPGQLVSSSSSSSCSCTKPDSPVVVSSGQPEADQQEQWCGSAPRDRKLGPRRPAFCGWALSCVGGAMLGSTGRTRRCLSWTRACPCPNLNRRLSQPTSGVNPH